MIFFKTISQVDNIIYFSLTPRESVEKVGRPLWDVCVCVYFLDERWHNDDQYCSYTCIYNISAHDLWAQKPLKRIYKSWMCDRVNVITMQHHINSTMYIYDSCFALIFHLHCGLFAADIVRSRLVGLKEVFQHRSNKRRREKKKCADICRILKMEIYTITLRFILSSP